MPHASAILPSRNEASTIAAVTAAVDAALDDPHAVIIHADSSDDPATSEYFAATPTRARKIRLTGLPRGKGFQILRALPRLPRGTGPVLIADTDTRNPDPGVYRRLLERAGGGCAIADYPRHWDEANLTNHLARPLIAATTGLDIPQPLAGDLALAPRTLTALPTATGSLTRELAAAAGGYGIDALLLLTAAHIGPITPVSVPAPKLHAASFPHLPDIFDQAVPVLLALTAAHPMPAVPSSTPPLYRAADRPLTTEHRNRMLGVLDDLAPHEPRYDSRPWPLPLADVWHAVTNGTQPTTRPAPCGRTTSTASAPGSPPAPALASWSPPTPV